MSRTKKYIVVLTLLGLSYLFITEMPYGDLIMLKRNLLLIPHTVGEWTGYEAFKQERNFSFNADQYLYRKYVNTHGQSLFLNIIYLEKFNHEANIFSGNYIDPGFMWDVVSEKNIFIELKGKKYPVKEIVFVNGNDYISLVYWYYTNHGITTKRFKERLFHGLDAMRNRRTNVALVKIISSRYAGKVPLEIKSNQVEFAGKIFPLLADFLPFDQ